MPLPINQCLMLAAQRMRDADHARGYRNDAELGADLEKQARDFLVEAKAAGWDGDLDAEIERLRPL